MNVWVIDPPDLCRVALSGIISESAKTLQWYGYNIHQFTCGCSTWLLLRLFHHRFMSPFLIGILQIKWSKFDGETTTWTDTMVMDKLMTDQPTSSNMLTG